MSVASFLTGEKLLAGSKFVIGKYNVTIEKYIAEGGFSHVYLVQTNSKTDGSPITAVLKRMYAPDENALRFVKTEIETMELLKSNPHVVSYIDSCIFPLEKAGVNTGFEILLLMEYCAGGGLIDFMNQRLQTRLSEHEVLKIISDIVQGVASLHYLRPPLIHRDLKVENVLLSFNTFKLCDFGSVTEPMHAAENSSEIQALEKSINTFTTYQYRAPEMINLYSGLGIDEKSDMWALGVLLYKLCYYTTPFETQGPNAILTASYSFPPFPPYSHSLKNVIIALLQPNPCLRPNIFQLMCEICRLRGTALPFRDIYSGRESSFYDLHNRKIMSLLRQTTTTPFAGNQVMPTPQVQGSRPPPPPPMPAPIYNVPNVPTVPTVSPNPFLQPTFSGTSQASAHPSIHSQSATFNNTQDVNRQSVSSPKVVSSSSVTGSGASGRKVYTPQSKNPFPISQGVTGTSSKFSASEVTEDNGSPNAGLDADNVDVEEVVNQRYPDLNELESQLTSHTNITTSSHHNPREQEIAKLADDAFASFRQTAGTSTANSTHTTGTQDISAFDTNFSEGVGSVRSSFDFPDRPVSRRPSSTSRSSVKITGPSSPNARSMAYEQHSFNPDDLSNTNFGSNNSLRHAKSFSKYYSPSHKDSNKTSRNTSKEGLPSSPTMLYRTKSNTRGDYIVQRTQQSANPLTNIEPQDMSNLSTDINASDVVADSTNSILYPTSTASSVANTIASDVDDFGTFNGLQRTVSLHSERASLDKKRPSFHDKNPYFKFSPSKYVDEGLEGESELRERVRSYANRSSSSFHNPDLTDTEIQETSFNNDLRPVASIQSAETSRSVSDRPANFPEELNDTLFEQKYPGIVDYEEPNSNAEKNVNI